MKPFIRINKRRVIKMQPFHLIKDKLKGQDYELIYGTSIQDARQKARVQDFIEYLANNQEALENARRIHRVAKADNSSD